MSGSEIVKLLVDTSLCMNFYYILKYGNKKIVHIFLKKWCFMLLSLWHVCSSLSTFYYDAV